MKTTHLPFFFLFSLFFFLILPAQSPKHQIAVLNLEAVGISQNESITLSDRLRSELVQSGVFTVIERSEMETILKEQGFQQTGCTSDECAVEIGQLLNISQICAGSVGKVGSLYTISLRLIDVQTGAILLTVNEDCQCPIETVLVTSMKNIAQKLVDSGRGVTGAGTVGAGKGDIYLKSNPVAATIFVDGQDIRQNTPATIRNLSSGEHEVKVVKGDYVGSKVILVRPNDIVEELIVLGKARGGLKVYSDPAEADIFIGEEYHGKTPKVIRDLSAGEYLVTLKKPGYLDHKKRISVKGESFSDVEERLIKPASLKISSTPSNATVSIRGQEMGRTPFTAADLLPERVYVEVSHPGYKTDRRYVNLQEAFQSSEQFTLVKLPSVQVTSEPSGARVYVNDNFKGMTPLKVETITEEKVKVEVKKEYFEDWAADLVLEAGRDETLNAQLKAKKGQLVITTDPAGMVVALDDKMIGNSPVRLNINYGQHNMKLAHQQYETVEEELTIDQPQVSRTVKMELKRGVLSVNGLSKSSMITIDGYNVKLENSTARLPIGAHKVVIDQSGYEKRTHDVNIQSGKESVISGSLNRKTTGKALVRSLFIPGLGQSYQEKQLRKWYYPALFVAAAAGSWAMVRSYNTAVDDYDGIRDRYEAAFSVNEVASYREQMSSAYDDVESKEQTRNILLMAVGAVWLWNVVDALVLQPGYTAGLALDARTQDGHVFAGVSVRLR